MVIANPYGIRHPQGLPNLAEDGAVVFRPGYNSPGKHDVSGAFAPEALRFQDTHHVGIQWSIDNRLPGKQRRERFLSALQSVCPVGVFAYFGHGLTRELSSINLASPGSARCGEQAWNDFCTLLAKHPAPTVVLYACSSGGKGTGDGSFGDELRDELCRRGCIYCRVVAHTTSGHTTANPYIRIFEGTGHTEGGEGGDMLIAPGEPGWGKLRKKLSAPAETFRYRFPFMTIADIHKELGL